MSGWALSVSSPFGPFTLTCCSFTATSMPAATGIGFLPIRDMSQTSRRMLSKIPAKSPGSKSINLAEDLAAHVLGLGLAAAEDALVRRQDVHAQSLQHFGSLVDARVNATA